MISPEILNHPEVWATITSIITAGLMAFSREQRKAIKERDGEKCNFPGEHICAGRLEIHHLLPQRYAKVMKIDPDYPENGLTICHNAHCGVNGVHPDMEVAHEAYRHGDKRAFERAMTARDEALENREIYWDTTWDRRMQVVAVRNTQRASAGGWEFPANGHKNGRGGKGK